MGSPRTFTDSPAARSQVPLLIGLSGPSGSGKTWSALRLATGIQRVTGGEIFGIDTEADRMLALADYFKFRHVPFSAPFGPLDYLAAIEHCVKRGAKVIVVDSMSHEHEGPGGVLEQHEAECQRLLAAWRNATRDSVQFAAWAQPKAARRRLLNTLVQTRCSFIFCFRSKEATSAPEKGKKPEKLGWVPIAGADFLYEQTINFLLPQMSDGTPTWQRISELQEARLKAVPQFFRTMFEKERQLDEATGEAMARWAAGGAAATGSATASPAAVASTTPTSTVSAPATVPKASAGQLEALATQLGANGLSTKDARREWFWKLTGKTLSDATADDVQRAIEQAEVEAA